MQISIVRHTHRHPLNLCADVVGAAAMVKLRAELDLSEGSVTSVSHHQ